MTKSISYAPHFLLFRSLNGDEIIPKEATTREFAVGQAHW